MFPDANNLYVGDCMDIMAFMPDDYVDIVVTSPPYNQLGSSRKRAKGWSTSPGIYAGRTVRCRDMIYDDDMPEREYQAWMCSVVAECVRVAKGLVWINHKIRYRENVGIHPLRFLPYYIYAEVIWDRGGSLALNCKRFAPSHEVIYGFGTRHWWDDESNKLMSVWRITPTVNEDHPCSFPIEIPARLIAASCPPGGIVLDPFVGIGTTALAAIDLGRRYIGIDIQEKYIQVGRDRIAGDLIRRGFEEVKRSGEAEEAGHIEATEGA